MMCSSKLANIANQRFGSQHVTLLERKLVQRGLTKLAAERVASLDCNVFLTPHPERFGLHDGGEDGYSCLNYAQIATESLNRRARTGAPMSDVFISYAREDRTTAKDLARALEEAGFSVWWDREILAGKQFSTVIRESLNEAKCIIVLWSDRSISSSWVRDEATEGVRRNILVPALIDDVDLPLGFGQLQAADLISWKGQSDHEGLQKILQSTAALVGGERKPVPPATVSWWRRALNFLTLAILGFLGFGAVTNTCSNPDVLVIVGIVALAVCAFMIVRVRSGSRYLWVVVAMAWLAVGMPYGNAYGTAKTSSIFGLVTFELCHIQHEKYLMLAGILATAVVVDLFFGIWPQRRCRWVPVVSALVLLGGIAGVVVSYALRHSDQYDYAEELSRKYGYFSLGDERWNHPTATGFENNFQSSGAVVRDAATGLVWQRVGSAESIGFSEIPGYLSELNTNRFGGFDDWRLPSLAEAWTLLEYRQRNGLHIDPLFGSDQKWIWTSSIAEDGYGWFLFFNYGRPIFQNAWGSHAYVRAVRGPVWE